MIFFGGDGRWAAPRFRTARSFTTPALTTVALALACTPSQQADVPGPLVQATWLADHLDQVVVVDIRNDPAEGEAPAGYATGHIPGAVHAPYGTTPWRVTREDVSGMMPSLDEMEALVGGLGIANEDHVVIVSAGGSAGDLAAATRVYWQLKVIGHERLSILDGGHVAWTSAGLPTEATAVHRAPERYAGQLRPELVASRTDVERALADGVTLVDARTPAHYRGEEKSSSVARPGTLPGARNTPFTALFSNASGRFVSAEEAAGVWERAGVEVTDAVIAFCNTGQQASMVWFVSHELLGNENARLYDGSLTEWAADESRPMQAASPGER